MPEPVIRLSPSGPLVDDEAITDPPLSNVIYVDQGTLTPADAQTGAIGAPYSTLAAAILAAESLAVANVVLLVTPGSYTEGPLSINFAGGVTIQGIGNSIFVDALLATSNVTNLILENVSGTSLESAVAGISMRGCFFDSVQAGADTGGAPLFAFDCLFDGTLLYASELELDLCTITALSTGIQIDNATPTVATITRTHVASGSAPIAVEFLVPDADNILQLDDISTFLPHTQTDQFSVTGGTLSTNTLAIYPTQSTLGNPLSGVITLDVVPAGHPPGLYNINLAIIARVAGTGTVVRTYNYSNAGAKTLSAFATLQVTTLGSVAPAGTGSVVVASDGVSAIQVVLTPAGIGGTPSWDVWASASCLTASS